MPKAVFSRPFVDRATCGPGKAKVDYFDSEQRGFMLEVRRSGGKTYYQRYTDERGRERQYKIGPATRLRSTKRAKRPASFLRRPFWVTIRRLAGANCARYPLSPSWSETATCRTSKLTNAAGERMKPSSAFTSCLSSALNLWMKSQEMASRI